VIPIINRSKADENIEMDRLIKKYANIMFRCAHSYCGNRTDAEDIIQEVFLKYLNKSPEFKNDDHEKAWLLRVTINTSKDYVKSFWHQKTTSITEDIPYINDTDVEIWGDVKKLSPKYRVIIQLFYQEGYSIKEISELLKIRESTIGTQLSRAREILKKIIKEE